RRRATAGTSRCRSRKWPGRESRGFHSRAQQKMTNRLPRILIADDNAQGVELLEAYLSGPEYELQTAADGEETLRTVKDWQPDLILLDIMMPKISGFEVCKRIKANPATRDIVVLMITA